MRRSFNATTVIVLIALLWSFAHPATAQRRRPMPDTPGVAEPIDLEAEQIEESETDAPAIEKPAAAVPAQQDTTTSGTIDPNQTEINVKNADIAAVVRIFSKKTKRNYILDERVKGKVSIYLPGKVSAEESLKILDSVLALKGFSPVPLGENLWKIVPSKEAKQSTIPTIKGDSQSSRSNAVVTRILNLKYIAAEEAREVIAQLVSPDGLVSAYGGTNSLLMIDYEDNVSRLVDILNTVDVPFSNREMTIIPIKNADAPDIQKKLAEVLGIGEQSGKGEGGTGGAAQGSDLLRARLNTNAQGGVIPANEGGAPATGGSQAPAGSAVSSKTLEPKIIADERTNSILVVADDETTARIRALISQLDSEQDLSGYRFYVYKCQHAKADELAQTLAGLMGGQASGGGGQTTGSNLLDMGGEDGSMRTRGTQFNRTQDRLGSQQRTPGRSRTETQPQQQAPTSVQFGKNMSITADRSTNTLIINAGKAEYEKIKSLLQQLDVKRRQVLVEAMLLEVRADDTADYGFDWLTSGGGADGGVAIKNDFGSSQNSLTTLFSNPSAISGFSVAAASKGSLKLPGGIVIPTQSVLLTAAQSNSNINILSAPNILTTDNEEAQIVVGQNVPFIAGRSTDLQNINNQFNQIERQDVGITLRLTPQISSESFVNLKLFTEVSSIASQSVELGPTTSIRTSETSIIAKDGQMVVIGGLMADAKNDTDSGVPFLKDIPVLGWAFKSSNTQTQKTNLLIFITPRILQDQYDARDVSKERSGDMADELDKQKSLPDRSNVLRSDKMDKVTDIRDFDGTKPTTILPPTDSAANTEANTTNTAPAAVTKEFTTDSPGVIQLKVAPKFPKSITSSLNNKGTEAPQRRVILFKTQKVEGMERLPFSPNPSSGVFGIEVPTGSSQQAVQFFTDHQQFRYESGEQSLDLTQVGTYADRQSATSAQQGSLTFYTLSPFEVMNLGKKLWVKR